MFSVYSKFCFTASAALLFAYFTCLSQLEAFTFTNQPLGGGARHASWGEERRSRSTSNNGREGNALRHPGKPTLGLCRRKVPSSSTVVQALMETSLFTATSFSSSETVKAAFNVATFGPQPFWVLLILFPNAKITKQIMGDLVRMRLLPLRFLATVYTSSHICNMIVLTGLILVLSSFRHLWSRTEDCRNSLCPGTLHYCLCFFGTTGCNSSTPGIQ